MILNEINDATVLSTFREYCFKPKTVKAQNNNDNNNNTTTTNNNNNNSNNK